MAITPTTSKPLGFIAPSFMLPETATGRSISSETLFGSQPTVVIFMCNHCPFVIHIMDGWVALVKEYQSRGVQIVAISSNDVTSHPQDGPEHMKVLATERGFTFPYLYDETQEVARAYDAACTPDFSVFDNHRKCVYRGQFDASRPGNGVPVSGSDLRHVLDALLAGEDVPEEGQIPSIGCNIKWKA